MHEELHQGEDMDGFQKVAHTLLQEVAAERLQQAGMVDFHQGVYKILLVVEVADYQGAVKLKGQGEEVLMGYFPKSNTDKVGPIPLVLMYVHCHPRP